MARIPAFVYGIGVLALTGGAFAIFRLQPAPLEVVTNQAVAVAQARLTYHPDSHRSGRGEFWLSSPSKRVIRQQGRWLSLTLLPDVLLQ